MRKACGEPLILWFMFEETRTLKSPCLCGPGLGQPRANAVPWGCQGSSGCHPPCCLAVVGPRWAPCQAQAALAEGLSAQDCHPSLPSDAFPPLPLAALCLVLGCMIFPDGWDAETIRDMCGEKTGKYSLGDCSVRWAYILAIIGILNALILSFLAFVLGNRQNDLLHEELKTESKGERRAAGRPSALRHGPGEGILGGNSPGGLAPLAACSRARVLVGLTATCKARQAGQGGSGLPRPFPA